VLEQLLLTRYNVVVPVVLFYKCNALRPLFCFGWKLLFACQNELSSRRTQRGRSLCALHATCLAAPVHMRFSCNPNSPDPSPIQIARLLSKLILSTFRNYLLLNVLLLAFVAAALVDFVAIRWPNWLLALWAICCISFDIHRRLSLFLSESRLSLVKLTISLFPL